MTSPLVKLKECCTVIGGATPRREVDKYWESKDVPCVTPKDISNLRKPVLEDAPEYISTEGFKSCATFLLPKNSILLTSRAPIGNVAITGREMCTNQGFKSLIPGESVDHIYLYYCMLAHSEKLQALGNGATFKEVSKKIVEDFEIPLPSLPEQKRIAAILDKADAIRRKRQQAIQLADDFLRAVFLDMFGDPALNPKEWKESLLSELCLEKMNNGIFKKNDEYGNGLPVAWVSELFGNPQITFSEKTNYIAATQKEIDKYGLYYGDILFCRSSLKLEGIGWNNLYLGNEKEALFECHIIRMRPRQDCINPIFLNFQLRLPGIRARVFSQAKTVTMTTIDQDGIGKVKVIVPEKALQDKFEVIFRKTINYIDKIKEKNDLDILFKSLSQMAFSGIL